VNVANNPFKDTPEVLVDTPVGKLAQGAIHLVGGCRPIDEPGKRAADSELLQRGTVLAHHIGGAVASVEDVTDTTQGANHAVDVRLALGHIFVVGPLADVSVKPRSDPRVRPEVGVEHIAPVVDVRAE
jgi:hypothetical protein